MRTRHPYPCNWRAVQTASAWEVVLYDENTPVAGTGIVCASEQEAKALAAQTNLEYELHNIPTP